MINEEIMNALREDIRREQEERYHRIMPIFMEAYENGNLDKAASLVMTVPEIMSDGLEMIYSKLTDEQKYLLPLECYQHNGDSMPVVRKYVRKAKNFMPLEKRIPAELIHKPIIEVFRAGEENLSKAKYRISWTTDLDVARWFYDRNTNHIGNICHLYRATIRPEQIIWYTDNRSEKEVMQYGSVRNVTELAR